MLELKSIPHKPGVYIYKNQRGKVLYVGKAIDLYSRVNSYFHGNQPVKTAQLVSLISKIETIIVESEIEALVLEANLIKRYLPPFNVRLTDDKDYLYIIVTKEVYPKILTARKQELEGSQEYFGPFPSSRTVRETLKRIRRVFPWCSLPPKSNDPRTKPCFYYHLKLCPGACVGQISKEDYQKNIERFCRFMSGQAKELIDDLTSDMNQAAERQQYEKASSLKKAIEGINYLLQPNKASVYLENPNYLSERRDQALLDLQSKLNLLELPNRIECFDISNIQGSNAVGSMVVLTNGEIDKSQYRKFKIKTIVKTGKPNDFLMISEIILRRFKNSWPLPQLILIDGGIGQVRAAKEILKKLKIEIPLFGLAKKHEWLYSPEDLVIKLPKTGPSSLLLQRIRDEAHRFALNYHRLLRNKSSFS